MVRRVSVAGVELAAGTYQGEDWMDGAGSVTVSGQVPAGQFIWWRPTSGAWTDAANWLSGQVPSGADTAIVNVEGSYAITYGSTATKPAKIELGVAEGRVTLQLDGDVSFNSGELMVGRNARLEIPAAASLSCDGAPKITVDKGELAVCGGSLVVTNFAGTFTVCGSSSCTGRVTATGGTIRYATSSTSIERAIALQANGEMTLSADSVFENLTDKQVFVRLAGGRFVGEDTRLTSGNARWYFFEDETLFSGSSVLSNGHISSTLYFYPRTAGVPVHVSVTDHATFTGVRFDGMRVGDDGSDNSAAADTVVDFDSDRLLQNEQNMLAFGTMVSSRKGKAVFNLRKGWLNPGARGLRVGTASGGRYGLNAITGYKGTVNICGGALHVQATSVSEGFLPGLTLGDGASIDESVRETAELFEGRFNQTGGVVTNKSNLLVGGPRGLGEFVLTGGAYRNANWGYPFIVGAAGGKGTCLLGGGQVVVHSQMYVGGVFTNAIPHDAKAMAYCLALWGWPVDNHAAEGTLTVTGGVVALSQSLNVGFDGKGTVAVVGSLPTITVAGDLVLSNTVETATSSTLKFTFDENGVSPIQVADKLVNTAGTKLKVDLGRYSGRKCSHCLVACGGLVGPAISDVEISGDLAGRARCETTNNGLWLRLLRGMTIGFR